MKGPLVYLTFLLVFLTRAYAEQEATAPTNLCATRWFTQRVDHFAFRDGSPTFKQRVLTQVMGHKPGHPLFVYFGNEAPVELYVDHSGLMWENYQKFGAGLIFMEHRFYGQSTPKESGCRSSSKGAPLCDLSLLSTEQAMRDYAVIIETFRRELKPSAVIGFGGSYGGMLATYMRMKYPNLVDGVIAASAPVLSYLGMNPPYDPNAFARVVTNDAGPICATQVKASLTALGQAVQSGELSKLSNVFKTCAPLQTKEAAHGLLEWASNHFDYLAMGNFPYPSSYLVPDGAQLPAWPVKAACELMDQTYKAKDPLSALVAAASLFYNATGKVKCYYNEAKTGLLRSSQVVETQLKPSRSLSALRASYTSEGSSSSCGGSWDWQWCTQHVMPFVKGTAKDMFYPYVGFDLNKAKAECAKEFGLDDLVNIPTWSAVEHGGLQGFQKSLTNVVFSNGLLDPWSAGGVVNGKGFDQSVVVVLIPNGAHHIDLMFSNPEDPADVTTARNIELANIRKWINQAKSRVAAKEFIQEEEEEAEPEASVVKVHPVPAAILEFA